MRVRVLIAVVALSAVLTVAGRFGWPSCTVDDGRDRSPTAVPALTAITDAEHDTTTGGTGSAPRTERASTTFRKKLPDPPADDGPPPHVIVKGSASALRSSGAKLGFRMVRTIPSLGYSVLEPVDPGESPDVLAARVVRAGVAHAAEPAQVVHPAARPNDSLFGLQWGYENTGQSGGTPGADTQAVSAWDWSRGAGTVVAVTDTGVDVSAADLSGKAWVNPAEVAGNGLDDDGNGYVDDVNGYDFFNGDSTVYDAGDGDQHGTHVAGTIAAATDNGIGVSGMGWDTRFMALKFIGPSIGTDYGAAEAIAYAVDNGADVINASWGGYGASSIIEAAVGYAASKGVLVVCAAGNEGYNADVTPMYPAAYPATNVVSVAALDRNDALAPFSNRGATSVDIGAPGVSIASTVPRWPGGLFVDRAGHKAVYLSYPLESVTSSTLRTQMMSASMGLLATSTANPVLLVDDAWQSRSAAYEPVGTRIARYQTMLSGAGYSNVATWSTEASGTPPVSVMAGKTVVWFTGAASFSIPSIWPTIETHGTLTTAERTEVAAFLNGGGRLLVSSGDLGYEMWYLNGSKGTLNWLRTYLGATYLSDDPMTTSIVGRSGSAFAGFSGTVSDAVRTTDGFDETGPADSTVSALALWPHDYLYMNGTSMAAPHVSGIVALMMARSPSMTAEQVRARLLSTARPVAALSGVTVTGGAVNAASAVGTLTAPTGLTSWPADSDALRLAWVDPPDDDHQTTRVLVRTDAPPQSPTDPAAVHLYEGAGEGALHDGLSVGQTLHYAIWAQAALGGWSEPARLTTTVADLGPGVAVPPGDDVSASFDGVTLRFPWNAGGWLSITRIPPRHDPPAGMQWVGTDYFDVHPYGEFGTPVEIAIAYDPDSVTSESGLRLMHRDGGEWVDVTSSVDTDSKVVRGVTGSFSDFALVEPLGGPVVEADAGDTMAVFAVGLILVGVVIRRRVRVARVARVGSSRRDDDRT